MTVSVVVPHWPLDERFEGPFFEASATVNADWT